MFGVSHYEALGNERSHAVAEQNQRQLGKILEQLILHDECVVNDVVPAVFIRKMPEIIRAAILTVSAMVVGHDVKAGVVTCKRETLVTRSVLSEAVKNLYDASWIRGDPAIDKDAMTVGRVQVSANTTDIIRRHGNPILYSFQERCRTRTR